MNILVVGDVHGCYHTFKKLVKNNWDSDNEILIQLGDLVNKGKHSAKCVRYAMKLQKKFPGKVIFLKGNHEYIFGTEPEKGEYKVSYKKFVSDVKLLDLSKKKVISWLQNLPVLWESDDLVVTHAGIAKDVKDPFDESNTKSVLFNKGGLKYLEKVQVKGHSVMAGGKPVFKTSENAWYVDTGAWYRGRLSALRFTTGETLPKVVIQQLDKRDKK